MDEVLGQFYEEVRKRDGGDYEPDCLRVIQTGLHRCLLEQNLCKINYFGHRICQKANDLMQAKLLHEKLNSWIRENLGNQTQQLCCIQCGLETFHILGKGVNKKR